MEKKIDQKPYISIIIPAKNEERYIEKCLCAVSNLYLSDYSFEIIVVDNNSLDNTKEIVKKFKNIMLLEKAEGTIGAVRNYGATHAKGEILAFLDADCVPDKEWLERGWSILKNDESIGCVGFDVAAPGINDSWVEKTWYKMGSSSKHQGTTYVEWLSSFNLILRKKIFWEVNGFDETLETCEDADLGQKMNNHCKLLFSDEIKIEHLGNVKTLKEFFFKECWRGKSNLKSFFKNKPLLVAGSSSETCDNYDWKNYWKSKLKGSPSVFIPICFVLAIISFGALLILYFFNMKYYGTISSLLLGVVSFPVLLALKKNKSKNLVDVVNISILYFIYLVARGLAALQSIM